MEARIVRDVKPLETVKFIILNCKNTACHVPVNLEISENVNNGIRGKILQSSARCRLVVEYPYFTDVEIKGSETAGELVKRLGGLDIGECLHVALVSDDPVECEAFLKRRPVFLQMQHWLTVMSKNQTDETLDDENQTSVAYYYKRMAAAHPREANLAFASFKSIPNMDFLKAFSKAPGAIILKPKCDNVDNLVKEIKVNDCTKCFKIRPVKTVNPDFKCGDSTMINEGLFVVIEKEDPNKSHVCSWHDMYCTDFIIPVSCLSPSKHQSYICGAAQECQESMTQRLADCSNTWSGQNSCTVMSTKPKLGLDAASNVQPVTFPTSTTETPYAMVEEVTETLNGIAAPDGIIAIDGIIAPDGIIAIDGIELQNTKVVDKSSISNDDNLVLFPKKEPVLRDLVISYLAQEQYGAHYKEIAEAIKKPLASVGRVVNPNNVNKYKGVACPWRSTDVFYVGDGVYVHKLHLCSSEDSEEYAMNILLKNSKGNGGVTVVDKKRVVAILKERQMDEHLQALWSNGLSFAAIDARQSGTEPKTRQQVIDETLEAIEQDYTGDIKVPQDAKKLYAQHYVNYRQSIGSARNRRALSPLVATKPKFEMLPLKEAKEMLLFMRELAKTEGLPTLALGSCSRVEAALAAIYNRCKGDRSSIASYMKDIGVYCNIFKTDYKDLIATLDLDLSLLLAMQEHEKVFMYLPIKNLLIEKADKLNSDGSKIIPTMPSDLDIWKAVYRASATEISAAKEVLDLATGATKRQVSAPIISSFATK